MSDQFSMFGPTTCEATPNATSSLALEPGATHCGLQDGQMINQSGPEVARAQVSRRQAKAEDLQTLVTSGLIGSDSFASASLQSSLESRLVQRLDTAGSTLFSHRWKRLTESREGATFLLP